MVKYLHVQFFRKVNLKANQIKRDEMKFKIYTGLLLMVFFIFTSGDCVRLKEKYFWVKNSSFI